MFLVRKGNPKQIHDWNDLIKPGVSVITPNPKAPAAPLELPAARAMLCIRITATGRKPVNSSRRCIKRGSAGLRRARFDQYLRRTRHRRRTDRENEALLATNELGKDKFEIVTPSESILAEPTVSVVDKVVDKKGTRQVAEAYLKYLYSPEGGDCGEELLPPARSECGEEIC